MTRPIDVVRKLCPRGKPSYLSAFENGDALFKQHGITMPLRLAHFLAQCLHETGGLSIEWESGNYTADRLMQIFGVGHHSAAVTASEAQQLAHNGPAIFERVYGLGNPKKARELGNTRPGDGYRYRGGGIMQTTGRANYARMGQKCGVDFEGHPEYVLSAEHALKPALAEWTEGKLNDAADADDIRVITRRINGGYNGLEDRKDWLRRLKPLISRVDLTDATAPATPAAAPPARRGTVTAQGLNLRTEASTVSAIAEVLKKDAVVEIIGETTNDTTKWLRVNVASGKSGWVSARYVAIEGI